MRRLPVRDGIHSTSRYAGRMDHRMPELRPCLRARRPVRRTSQPRPGRPPRLLCVHDLRPEAARMTRKVYALSSGEYSAYVVHGIIENETVALAMKAELDALTDRHD